MLTYTINKIMKTLEIALFLTLGVMLTKAFIITPLLVVLLLFTNDFVTMSIATDHVGFAPHPERWNVRQLMITGSILAGFVLLLSFGLFFLGQNVLGLALPQLQTLVFVMLVATGQGNLYLVRERGHFWASRPSGWMLAGTLIDLAVVALLATWGVFMAPVGPLMVLELLLVVALYLLVLDYLKVWLFQRWGFSRKPQ
jgi:H+-transporting ATPase